MVPEEYGGAGYDAMSAAIIIEEIARVDAAVALLVGSHNSLCSGHILLAGSEEQKRQYLPPLARGEKLGAWALTEPGSGSDAGAMRTRATLEGDCVGDPRRQAVHHARLDGRHLRHHGVDRSRVKAPEAFPRSSSIARRPASSSESSRRSWACARPIPLRCTSTTCACRRRTCWASCNEGFKDVLAVLAGARIGMAALAVGIAQGALDEALDYAKRRRQFGKPILEYEAIQWMLADMATESEAARLMAWHAASLQG